MKSWKTTVCGLVTLFGAGLTQFFPEYAKLGGFLAFVGSGAGLLFARDNKVTSEQAGAGKTASAFGLVLLLLIAVALPLTVLPGCKAPPQRIAFNSVNAPVATVQQAMGAWDDYVARFHPPISQQLQVKAAYERYQAAMILAMDAARAYADAASSTNGISAGLLSQATGQQAQQALTDLFNLLRAFGLKL